MEKGVLTDVIKKALFPIFIFIFLTPLSLANGFVGFLDEDYLKPLEIGEQIAHIEYKNGIEKLTIGINFDPIELRELKDKNTPLVWIFPIPASPEDVKIDITKKFPILRGYEIKSFMRDRIRETGIMFIISQFCPFLFFQPLFTFFKQGISITVHERIIKEGITTEIITAKDGVSIYSYLKDRGVKIDERVIPLLNMYVGKNYSFVVSWISSPERFSPIYHPLPLYERIFRGEFVGVTIEFPTKKIYYPMLLTSIYEDRKIKIRIYIEGSFVKINQEELNKISGTEYYVTFLGEPAYTKIEFNAPAKYYTKDLYIDVKVPASLSAYLFFFNLLTTPFFLIFIFLFLSFLTGVITSYLLFKNYRYGIFSIFNLLSIIGVLLSTLIYSKNFEKSITFTIMFVFFFFLFTFLFFAILTLLFI